MKRAKLCILVLFIPLMTGCWDLNEPERMLYIHGIGVDFKDDKYEVHLQIIDFANAAKSDQPVSEKVQSEVGYASGVTIDEAFFKLYHSTDQRLFWGHLSYMVFSEEVLKNGKLNPVIDSFIRYRETRYQIWLYCTKDPVEEVLLSTPIINTAITLSKLTNPKNSYKQSSFIPPVDIRSFIIGIDEPSYETIIPFVKVKKEWSTVEGENTSPSFDGVGVVSPNEFKGFIEGDAIRGLQWMEKDTVRGEVTIKQSSDNHDFLSVTLDNLKTKVKPIIVGDEAKFHIEVRMRGEVSSLHGKTTNSKVTREVEEEVEKQIRETYEHALNKEIDIYRLSEQVYRKENAFWKKHQVDGKIPLDEQSIDKVTVVLENLKAGRKSVKETIE